MKAKFKINQLAARPIKVELVHPTEGPTGIFVDMVGPHSSKLKAAFEEYQKLENPTEAAQVKLFAACLIGWDEEAFEMPFNEENVMTFFSQPENSWIAEQIAPKMMDRNIFFRPKSQEAERSGSEPDIVK